MVFIQEILRLRITYAKVKVEIKMRTMMSELILNVSKLRFSKLDASKTSKVSIELDWFHVYSGKSVKVKQEITNLLV